MKQTTEQRPSRTFVLATAGFIIIALAVGVCRSIVLLQQYNQHPKTPIRTSLPKISVEEPIPAQKPVEANFDQKLTVEAVKLTIPDAVIPPVENGLAPVISRLPTNQNVVFLGIDDGANKESFELEMMKQNHVKASLFLSDLFIHNNPTFFQAFTQNGSVIENHSVSHVNLTTLTYEQQKQEICGESDIQYEQFGRRPTLFRPPGGDYNSDTQRAAADCGMKAVVLWAAKANGGSMQYQTGDALRPGDIVLMHFRPEFKNDMNAFLAAEKAANLRTELLEDWLPAAN